LTLRGSRRIGFPSSSLEGIFCSGLTGGKPLFGDDDVDVHNTSEVLFRLRANNSATRDLESVGGENGFALILVKSCHGSLLFP